MPSLLCLLGAAVALSNAWLLLASPASGTSAVQIVSALAGIGIVGAALGFRRPASAGAPAAPAVPPAASPSLIEVPKAAAPRETPVVVPAPVVPAPAPHAAPRAPEAAPVRAEAEVVAFLGMLQEKGRLVDFLREDLAGASDEQIGAAARVVHAGCRKALDEHFDIAPVRTEAEGAAIVLQAGYDAPAHRLLGSVPAQPPYSGRLLHPGWAVRNVRLPRVTGVTSSRPWPVLAPAEVEIGK